MGGPPLRWRELSAAGLFALGSVIAILCVYIAFGGGLPFQADGYRFTVAFADAPTLVSGASVRISGVPVGSVVSVRPGESSTLAVIQLNPRYAPLPRDARAIVRTKTPLGESYVELTPGSPGGKPLPDGGRLPASQVAATQQLSDVLGVFDAPTRKAFEQVMVDTGAALAGEGPNLNSALGAAGTGAEQLNVLLDALQKQSGSVQTLISQSAASLRELAAQPAQLRRLIDAGDTVAGATSAHATALTATVGALARLVGALKRTDAPLTKLSDLATPTLRTLVSVAPLLSPALDATDRLAPALAHAFTSLRSSVPAASSGLDAASRILTQVPSVSAALEAAGAQTVPLVQLLDSYGTDAVTSLASFASALEPVKGTSGSTGSRYARTAIVIGSDDDLGFQDRPPWSRYNPYPGPGQSGDGKSLNCANTSNSSPIPNLGSQLACEVEQPWSFDGKTQLFPDLSPYAPKAIAAAPLRSRGRRS